MLVKTYVSKVFILIQLFEMHVLMRNDHYRSQNFYETTIPSYLPDTLRRFFRMSRTSFQLLFQHLAGCNEFRPRQYQGGRQEVTCEKAVLMILRYSASHETQLEI